jgi:hypothetical protein
MPRSAELEYADNPYRSTAVAPQDYAGFGSGDAIDELCAYVGPRADYYLRKWSRRLEDPSGDVGINWVAFFFPGIWLAYRKMYWTLFVYFAVVFLLGAGKELLFIFALHQPAAPLVVNAVFNVLTGLVCALYGNAWYLSQAQRTIATLRAQGYEGEELLFALAKRGGTSIAAIFIANLTAGLVLGLMIMMLIAVGAALHGM